MTRRILDFKLHHTQIDVSFLDGTKTSATAEGNNAAWNCQCGCLLTGRCYYQFGNTCYTECSCGKKYRVLPTTNGKKQAANVVEF